MTKPQIIQRINETERWVFEKPISKTLSQSNVGKEQAGMNKIRCANAVLYY